MTTNQRPRALRLSTKAASLEALSPELIDIDQPRPKAGEAVIEVRAAAVNPSDVKAALGLMPHAIWPRTPGRDYAGTVVAGPAVWIGVNGKVGQAATQLATRAGATVIGVERDAHTYAGHASSLVRVFDG